MRDALGGAVNIFIIVVFIVFALGYMAYNVNYTKAFRMKDKIVSVYEKYRGNCTDACEDEIKQYANSIGYATDYLRCSGSTDTSSSHNLYCVTAIKAQTTDNNSIDDMKTKCYYHIVTKINISVPLFENLFAIEGYDPDHISSRSLGVFYVTGDTKAIEVEGYDCD